MWPQWNWSTCATCIPICCHRTKNSARDRQCGTGERKKTLKKRRKNGKNGNAPNWRLANLELRTDVEKRAVSQTTRDTSRSSFNVEGHQNPASHEETPHKKENNSPPSASSPEKNGKTPNDQNPRWATQKRFASRKTKNGAIAQDEKTLVVTPDPKGKRRII